MRTLFLSLLALVAISVLCAVLLATLAARGATGRSLSALRATRGGAATSHRLRSGLVIGQVAAASALLLLAGFFVHALRTSDRGPALAPVLAAPFLDRVSLRLDDATARELLPEIEARVGALPGVESLAEAALHEPIDGIHHRRLSFRPQLGDLVRPLARDNLFACGGCTRRRLRSSGLRGGRRWRRLHSRNCLLRKGRDRASQQQSIDIKRNAVGVVDSIASEDLGKLPDQNVAESLQRIAGVTIERNRGEGRYVSVRGFGPKFNAVTVNGRTLATARTPGCDTGLPEPAGTTVGEAVAASRGEGRSVRRGDLIIAAVVAGADNLGALVFRPDRPLADSVRLRELSGADRTRLKDSLRAIREWQEKATYHYQTDLV